MKEPIHTASIGQDRTQLRIPRDKTRKLLVEPIAFYLARDRSNLLLREVVRSEENTWPEKINGAV
jgi:hypothetical protein